MKGFTKAIMRTPHLVTTKVGMSKKSNDPEFDEYQRKFTTLEGAVEKFLKDTKIFSESVFSLLVSGQEFSSHFAEVFKPLSGEYDLIGRYPQAQNTVRNTPAYQNQLEELRSALTPELELIESRIAGPVKELQGIMKTIRKAITKREHKLTDYDRFNNSLTKLRDKKEKSLSDEKNLFKLEQDFEQASTDYEHYNTSMKTDLPRFMVLATQFIDPLFHSFYYMQLNIFYLMMEKLQQFSDGKFQVGSSGADIQASYEQARGDVQHNVESLNITHRVTSTAKMMQMHRANSTLAPPGSGSSLNRSASTTSSLSASSAAIPPPPGPQSYKPPPSPGKSFAALKKGPPPAPGGYNSNAAAAPPPYSPPASTGGNPLASVAGTKRAPPPPPPMKSKPSTPAPKYVVALYDFGAQADGDLEFKVGDRIEVVERTASSEDWWTGKLNGRQGVFPGNYVQET